MQHKRSQQAFESRREERVLLACLCFGLVVRLGGASRRVETASAAEASTGPSWRFVVMGWIMGVDGDTDGWLAGRGVLPQEVKDWWL